MKEVFVTHSLAYLKKNNACNKQQENIFRYTLESLYSLVTKTSVVLLISIFLGTFQITFISMILFSLLRGFTFGIHASKNSLCWIITLATYSLFPYLIKVVNFPKVFIFSCYGIGLLSILFFAPCDTPKRPLLDKKKRIVNKMLSFGIGGSYVLISFIIHTETFSSIIAFIFLLTIICINPITYKIFKVPYNNYKHYYNS